MKKKYLIFIIIILCILYIVYFFYPRKLKYEYVCAVYIKNPSYIEEFMGCDIIHDSYTLKYRLITQPNFYRKGQGLGLDSIDIKNIECLLDYTKYDYIISYHKRINKIEYSPYLKIKDTAAYLDEYPLIPQFINENTRYIYIYKMKKNYNFRSVGP